MTCLQDLLLVLLSTKILMLLLFRHAINAMGRPKTYHSSQANSGEIFHHTLPWHPAIAEANLEFPSLKYTLYIISCCDYFPLKTAETPF